MKLHLVGGKVYDEMLAVLGAARQAGREPARFVLTEQELRDFRHDPRYVPMYAFKKPGELPTNEWVHHCSFPLKQSYRSERRSVASCDSFMGVPVFVLPKDCIDEY